jgi:large subunit ribosomal protein L22
MAFVSKWRFAKITARKARLLTDLIRNQPVGKALDLLKFNRKRGAVLVTKVLKSAMANADAQEADLENLYVSKSYCDDGPIMKRFMPKDRGKSYSIFKRMCHITVEVDEGTPPMKKGKRKQLENRREQLSKKKKKGGAGATATAEAKTDDAKSEAKS